MKPLKCLIALAVAVAACSSAPERAAIEAPSASNAEARATAAQPASASSESDKGPNKDGIKTNDEAQTNAINKNKKTAMEAELARIAEASGGTLGVAVLDIESGEIAAHNGTQRFPMQSVFKFPIAVQILKRVDAGEISLDQKVPIRHEDLRWGYSPIADRSPKGGVELPIKELLRAMVAESDNTACDVLLNIAGGPAAVTQMTASHGLPAIVVHRGEGLLILDFHGIPDGPGRLQRDTAAKLVRELPKGPRDEAIQRYLSDPRDTATPIETTRLLALLQQGKLLKPSSTALLLQIMTDTQTGPNRLRAGLPAGTPLAHKTGTSASYDGKTAVVNDVGIITLPNGRGHVAVAAFVKGANKGTAAAETAIAEAARAAFERWSQ
jgi:beta-lactamase class A